MGSGKATRGAILVAVSIAATLAGPTSAAVADPIGACSTKVGTIVAVDFGHWGGPIVRGCGVNDPSGYALLHAAGFTTAGDSHDGPGFMCRLGNPAFDHGTQYPTPKEDPCVVTPPASACWSYWIALSGHNTWSYSSVGAMSDVPKPGEVEAWVFGGTDTSGSGVPTFTPDSVRAHNAKPTITASPTPARTTPSATAPSTRSRHSSAAARDPSRTQPLSTGHAASPPATHAPAADSTPVRHRHRSTPSRTSTASSPGPASRISASAGPVIVDALPASTAHRSPGSAVPLIVGVALALLLGGAAAVAVRRRRGHIE